MTPPHILALGSNPAWQKTLFFDRLTRGEVNRAAKKAEFASGKGVNFCRAAVCWNRAKPELLQVFGGGNGQLMPGALWQKKSDVIDAARPVLIWELGR